MPCWLSLVRGAAAYPFRTLIIDRYRDRHQGLTEARKERHAEGETEVRATEYVFHLSELVSAHYHYSIELVLYAQETLDRIVGKVRHAHFYPDLFQDLDFVIEGQYCRRHHRR